VKVCEARGEANVVEVRRSKIEKHINDEGHPNLNDEERHAIRVIANALYENIKQESERSLGLYKQLDEAFVRK